MTGLSSSSKFYSLCSCNFLLFCEKSLHEEFGLQEIFLFAINKPGRDEILVAEVVPNVSHGIKFLIDLHCGEVYQVNLLK